MAVNYAFKKGVDLPRWIWLTQCPVPSTVSAGLKYDGARYLYLAQATSLYRFDTWTNGWQLLATPTTGGAGQDMSYDASRNVMIMIHGLNLTSWQVFNLNAVAVTIAGVICQPFVLTTMTPVLPAGGAGTGSSLSKGWSTDPTGPVLSGLAAAATGNTTTNVRATSTDPRFYAQLVGLQIRVLTGAQAGQRRGITVAVDADNITVAPALPAALAANDTFVIEAPTGTTTAGTTLALTDAAQAWIVNKYSNWDVEITGGTGVGQRRRIASNTATVLTLAAATTGNPRTGAFTTAPDATSTYRIIPSTDFLYFQTGGGVGFNRLDLVANPAGAWVAMTVLPAVSAGGAQLDGSRNFALGHLILLRGLNTSTIYAYDVGLNTWATVTPNLATALAVFSTGASMVLLANIGKMAVYDDLTTLVHAFDFATGKWDVLGNHPYIAGTAIEGKRIEEVVTPDGARFLYLLRAGGQEWFKVPLEWL